MRASSPLAIASLAILFALRAAAAPASTPASAPDDPLDQLFSATFHAGAPGAAILIAQDGRPLFRKSYGQANLELDVPLNPADRFRICSLTKQFTAVAILQLAHQQKIHLDDPLADYLPDYPAATRVTLRQLLTHTAGIPSADADWPKIWRQDLTLPQLLDLTRDKPLDFPPGSNFRYSNAGYVLLGAVIEKASGQPYADYLRSHIFQPAGMTDTCYDSDDTVIPHRVPGYVRHADAWDRAPFISMTQPFSAGSLLSTIDDLAKFHHALDTGKLVAPDLLAQAYTAVTLPDGRSTHYGFAWALDSLDRHPTRQHAGGMPGFSAFSLEIPDARLFIILLANTSDPPAPLHTLALAAARLVLHEPAPPPLPPLSPADLQLYPGAYRVAPDQSFIVSLDHGHLFAQLGRGRKELIPLAPDTFTTPDHGFTFTFRRDPSGHITRIDARPDAPGPDLTWPRTPTP
ncbi:MAG TPA: serine hydrolase domain-containing protein [Phycisphaerae bacterium]|nr:serine hydrolase domain-containing protein [Phycisphaerae bacterium]